jgi:ribosomal protein S6
MTDTEKDVREEDRGGDEPAVYELGYHIVPTVTEEALPQEVLKVTDAVKNLGGSFIAEGFPARTHLAYALSKNVDGARRDFDTAYFGWITFELEPENIADFKAAIEAVPSVLRFLIIRTSREALAAAQTLERISTGPAPEMKRLVQDESNAGTLSEKALDAALETIVSDAEKVS